MCKQIFIMQLKYSKNTFRSRCSISCTLELLGDKWTLLIIRDSLLLKLTSFNDFRSSPERIASNILSDRLDKLVRNGIMTKTKNESNKLKYDYVLTKIGLDLEPIVMAIADWGHRNIVGTNNAVDEAEAFINKQIKKQLT